MAATWHCQFFGAAKITRPNSTRLYALLMEVCEFCEQAAPLPSQSHCAAKSCQAAAAWQARALSESRRAASVNNLQIETAGPRSPQVTDKMIEAGSLILMAHGYRGNNCEEIVADILRDSLRFF